MHRKENTKKKKRWKGWVVGKRKAAKVDASVALMVRSRESLRSLRDGLEV